MNPFLAVGFFLLSLAGTYVSYKSAEESQKLQKEQLSLAEEAYRTQKAQTEQQLAQLAEDRAKWEEQTEEQRLAFQETLKDVQAMAEDPTSSKAYTTSQAELKKSYAAAESNIMENMAEGPERNRALRELRQTFADASVRLSADLQTMSQTALLNLGLPTGKPSPFGGAYPTYSAVPISGSGGVDLSGLGYLASIYAKPGTTPEKKPVAGTTQNVGGVPTQ